MGLKGGKGKPMVPPKNFPLQVNWIRPLNIVKLLVSRVFKLA